MTQYLPPNLLALFAPREPMPYLEPLDQLPWEKKPWVYNGVSKYLSLFEDPSETPAPTRAETREERTTRKHQEREDRHRDKLDRTMADWEPSNDSNADGDPFKTLFVGRINYDTSESKLRREFEAYGSIKRIHMVMDQEGKPRGYAFIEYERERDMNGESQVPLTTPFRTQSFVDDPVTYLMHVFVFDLSTLISTQSPWLPWLHVCHEMIVIFPLTTDVLGTGKLTKSSQNSLLAAYKHADGKKIDGKRVVVDVERGRTVKTWKPRRLGGGLGGTRIGAPHENIKYSGRVDERDMAREKDRERDGEREREGERPRERRERSRSMDRDRERRNRSRSRERKRRSRSRERDRDRRDRSRSRERKDRMNSNRRDRDKDRGRDKDRNRDKERGRDKDRDRERDKERGRDRERERDRKRDRDGDDRREVDDYRDKRIKIEGENSNGNSNQMEA